MIFSVFSYRDKKVGAHVQIFLDKYEPENEVKAITRSIRQVGDIAKLVPMIDIELYYLGTFDDESGTLTSCAPQFLLSFDTIVNPTIQLLKSKKEDSDNVIN